MEIVYNIELYLCNYMTDQEIVDFLNEIENNFPVNNWKINNIHIWPIIRIRLGFEFSKEQRKKNQKNKSYIKYTQLLFTCIKAIFIFVRDFQNNEFCKKKTDIIFLFPTIARTKVNRKYYVKQANPIIKVLEKENINYLCIEDFSNGIFRIPRAEKSVYYYSQIVKRLKRRHKNIDINLPEYEKFLVFLKTKLINVSNYNKNVIFDEIYRILNEKDFFLKILKRLNVKLGIVIGYYGFAYGFLLACDEMSIMSADLQHGIAGNDMFAYGRWLKIPRSGYEVLPNKFLTWSIPDRDAILKWAVKTEKHDAICIGNTWLDYWNRSEENFIKKNIDVVQEFKLRIAKPIILFTHQKPFGFPDWLIKTIKNNESYFWGIRLHPGDYNSKNELERIIRNEKLSNIEYKFFTEMPLPAIFTKVDLHLTGWSATAFEAKEFGLHSILLHEKGKVLYNKEIVKGICSCAFSYEELSLKIKQNISKKTQKIDNEDAKKSLKDAIYSCIY